MVWQRRRLQNIKKNKNKFISIDYLCINYGIPRFSFSRSLEFNLLGADFLNSSFCYCFFLSPPLTPIWSRGKYHFLRNLWIGWIWLFVGKPKSVNHGLDDIQNTNLIFNEIYKILLKTNWQCSCVVLNSGEKKEKQNMNIIEKKMHVRKKPAESWKNYATQIARAR